MPTSRKQTKGKLRLPEPVSARPEQRDAVEALARLIERVSLDATGTAPAFTITGPGGETAAVPDAIRVVIVDVSLRLARGETVRIVPDEALLTTQEAADLLSVSRQYLVRLLEANEIPYSMTGTHRRLKAEDVLAYRSRRDLRRRMALDELVRASEEVGGYEELRSRPDKS